MHVDRQPQILVSSKHYLRLIETSFRIGSWSAHLASGAVSCSRGFRSLAGLEAASLTADALVAAIHPDDRALMSELMADLALTDEEHVVRVVRGDGSVRALSCWTDTLRDAWDAPHTRICVARDVTDRQRTEERVRHDQALLDVVTSATNAACWRMNAKGASKVSSSWKALTGQTLQAMQQDGWLSALHPEDQSGMQAAWIAAAAVGQAIHREVRIRRAAADHSRMRLSLVPLRNEKHELTEWVGVAVPIPVAGLNGGDGQVGPPLNSAQLRACRGLLDWTVADLARESGISPATIARAETCDADRVRPATRAKLKATLEAHGVIFGAEGNVRLDTRIREEGLAQAR